LGKLSHLALFLSTKTYIVYFERYEIHSCPFKIGFAKGKSVMIPKEIAYTQLN